MMRCGAGERKRSGFGGGLDALFPEGVETGGKIYTDVTDLNTDYTDFS